MRLVGALTAGVAVVCAVVTACSASTRDSAAGAPSVRDSAAGPASSHDPVSGFRSVASAPATAEPVRVRIPVLGVDAPVERLGLLADGSVAVPRRWADVGWYRNGPSPGEPGPAVILGHVDSTSGPAVFYRLRDLHAGDIVEVVRRDGSVVRFVVSRIARYAKTRFPTHAVYLPTLRPELRLVTCGGAFDAGTGHYVDNVVAYAVVAG